MQCLPEAPPGPARLRRRPRWRLAKHRRQAIRAVEIDLLPGLRAANHSDVLVVPVQFLADHLEILYDIDVAAAEEAERAGITLHRIEMPNTSPALIRALVAVVQRELDRAVR